MLNLTPFFSVFSLDSSSFDPSLSAPTAAQMLMARHLAGALGHRWPGNTYISTHLNEVGFEVGDYSPADFDSEGSRDLEALSDRVIADTPDTAVGGAGWSRPNFDQGLIWHESASGRISYLVDQDGYAYILINRPHGPCLGATAFIDTEEDVVITGTLFVPVEGVEGDTVLYSDSLAPSPYCEMPFQRHFSALFSLLRHHVPQEWENAVTTVAQDGHLSLGEANAKDYLLSTVKERLGALTQAIDTGRADWIEDALASLMREVQEGISKGYLKNPPPDPE